LSPTLNIPRTAAAKILAVSLETPLSTFIQYIYFAVKKRPFLLELFLHVLQLEINLVLDGTLRMRNAVTKELTALLSQDNGLRLQQGLRTCYPSVTILQ